jgi:hypothetical protein
MDEPVTGEAVTMFNTFLQIHYKAFFFKKKRAQIISKQNMPISAKVQHMKLD